MDLGPPPNEHPILKLRLQAKLSEFNAESPGPHRVELSRYGLTDNPDALNLGWRQAI